MAELNETYILDRVDLSNFHHWLWTGGTDGGYAKGSRGWIHRLSYRTFVGPIPKGHEVGHLCLYRRCVSPACLSAMTPWQNCETISRPQGWGGAAKFRDKTHCPQGHEYNKKNTYIYRGTRACNICRGVAVKRSRSKKCQS